MQPIEILYPIYGKSKRISITPGDLIKYRLNTGMHYSGVFLGLTPVSQYQHPRLDLLVGERKESINVNVFLEIEVVGGT